MKFGNSSIFDISGIHFNQPLIAKVDISGMDGL
jgi:hypothetical protein